MDVSPNSPIITLGQTKQLTATADLARKLYFACCAGFGYGRINLSTVSGPVWASNNYSVASVDGTGLVTAISVGVCTVSATYTRDAIPFTDSAVVTVIATSAPLAPEVSSGNRIHRVTPIGEISVPRVTRSWELFQ